MALFSCHHFPGPFNMPSEFSLRRIPQTTRMRTSSSQEGRQWNLYYSMVDEHYAAGCYQRVPTNKNNRSNKQIKCNSCGESYSHFHKCKATSRMCFNCRLYGHYASFCPKPSNQELRKPECKVRPSVSVLSKSVDINSVTNQNSENKSFCDIMPFKDLDNHQFKKICSFNNHHLEELASLLDDNITYTNRMIKNLENKSKIHTDELQLEISDLKQKCESQNDSLRVYEQVNHQLSEEIDRQCFENKYLKQTLKELESVCEKKDVTIKSLESTVNSHVQEISTLKCENHKYQDITKQHEVLIVEYASLEKAHVRLKSEHSKSRHSNGNYRGRHRPHFKYQNRYFN